MISLREIQELLTNKAFNPYIFIDNPNSVFLHLLEEIGELTKEHNNMINKGDNFNKLKKELGDVIILLCFYAESMNIDLEHETLMKIKENILKGKFKPNKEFLESLGDLFK